MSQEQYIRRALLKDALQIHELHMRSIKENCAKDYSKDEIDAWSDRLFDLKRRTKQIEEDYTWVITDEKKLYGVCSLISNPKLHEGYVKMMYLDKSILHKGWGKKFLHLIDETAHEDNLKTLKLFSTITALPFYKRSGFKIIPGDTFIEINGVQIRSIPMAKELNSTK